MGTAKSKIIEEVLFKARKRGLRVLFLTNRKSLANDVWNKYDGLKHYLGDDIEDNKYEIGDDLVVQLDSLHKFSAKLFDVVIMDEAATTLAHLLTLENHQTKIAKQVFSFSKKKLVLADAFIFDDMVDIFGNNVLHINNKYRDDVKLEFYSQRDKLILDLLDEAMNKPVTFSAGSTMILKIVAKIAKERGLKTVTLSAETPEAERTLIYKMMSKKKANYDILMYSPTLTVGVSNENQIDNHYHYDGGNSMNVLSSLQMTKRTRSAKSIKIFLAERSKYASTDLLRIQSQLTQFAETDEDGDTIAISKAGVNFSKLIKIHNILENRHKIAFIETMILQFKIKGNTSKITSRVTPFLNKISKVIKREEKEKLKSFFEAYREMSPERLADIEYKLFGTTKEEEAIKIFQIQMTDETLKLSDEYRAKLVEEEINNPGVIDAYKKNVKNNQIFESSQNGIVSIRNYNKYNKQGINLIEYGFTKIDKKYQLNKVIKDSYEYYATNTDK